MERIRRPRGSGHVKYSGPKSATGILVVIFGILAVVIVAAILFAPRKPPPPPVSSISYENKPKAMPADLSDDDDRPLRSDRRRHRPRKEAPSPPPQEQSNGRYQVFGAVKEFKTGNAIAGAQIHCELIGVREEIAALRKDNPKWNDELEKKFQALDEERRKNSARVQTDAEGKFSLRVEKPGDYLFRVWATGFIRLEDKHLTIQEGNESNHMDFEMSTGATISGRITESGSQKGAVGVTVEAEGPPPYRNDAQSDEDGKYTVSGLGPGEFTVTLRLRDCPYIVTGVVPTKNVTIRSETQEIRGVDFTVEAAGTVWGYVTSRDGSPIKGVDIVLCTSASVFSQVAEASLKQAPPLSGGSKDDGYYELLGVPLNKEWKLYAMSKDKAPQLTSPFILTQNQRTARIDVFISPGTTVYGRVVDAKRTPIENAEVLCIPAYSKFFSPLDSPQAFRNQKSDKDGLFQIPQLPVGEYQVLAQKRGYKFAAMGEPIYPDGINDITGVEVTLTQVEAGQFTVYGAVTDAAGKPIKDVSLSLGSVGSEDFSAGESNTTTDAQGNFTFQGVQSGLVMLRAEKPGYQGQNVTDVKLDGPTNIVMQAGATLKGTVLVKETGSPASGAMVRAIRVGGGSGGGGDLDFLNQGNGGSATTDASGSFSMEIDAGSYSVEARAQGLAPGRSSVTIEAGQNREGLVIYVRKDGARIQGRLTLADGKSPAGGLVWLSEGDTGAIGSIADIGGMGGQQRGIQVGSDGAYEFANLAAGTYTVYGRMETYAQGRSAPVDLGDGQSASGIDVVLSAGGALEGYVMVAGKPQPGALVTVIGENFVREPVAADESGHYRVEQIPAGNYLATATPINGGNIASILSPISARVQISEGMTTQHNFGEPTNTALIGMIEPPPTAGMRGVAVLLAPGVPVGVIPSSMGILSMLSWFSSNLDKFVGEASVEADGTFRIDNLVAGEYTLVVVLGNVADVLAGGGNRQSMAVMQVTIVDGQQVPITVPITAGS